MAAKKLIKLIESNECLNFSYRFYIYIVKKIVELTSIFKATSFSVISLYNKKLRISYKNKLTEQKNLLKLVTLNV